eukprot:gene11835-13063_t
MDIFKRFWNWRLEESPEFATAIGVHDFDSKLDDLGLDAFERRQRNAEQFLVEIENKQREFTDPSELLNYKLISAEINQFLRGMKYKSYLFPLNQLEGPQADFPRLISWMKTETVEDYEKILSRLRQFPTQIQQMIELLRKGINENYTMAMESIQSLPKLLEAIVDIPTSESKFLKPFLSFPASVNASKQAELKEKADKAITESVVPAYVKLSKFLSVEYLPHARASPGVSTLQNGSDYYQECLKFHTTTGMTPDEIHSLGKTEVARITEKMDELRRKVGYPGTLAEFKKQLKGNKDFCFKDEDDMFSTYDKVKDKIKPLLASIFNENPTLKYSIEPVPKDIAPGFPGAYYFAPSTDGSRPATFYLNTYKVEERSRMEAVSLSLHEAEPGHHFQAVVSMQHKHLTDFRRFMEDRVYYQAPGRFAMHTGYIEGWGLYCEYLGEELNLYEDPYDFFGRLSHEMLRASRLVIDTGIHAFGWSRDAAIKYMQENTVMAEADVIAEVERYITWPGQACAYKVGELKIKELREKALSQLGAKFNVKDFHSIVLSIGPVPLHVLEDAIDSYIKEKSE